MQSIISCEGAQSHLPPLRHIVPSRGISAANCIYSQPEDQWVGNPGTSNIRMQLDFHSIRRSH